MYKDIFFTCIADQKTLPANTMATVVSRCEQNALTGMLRVELDEVICALVFVNGAVNTFYQFRDGWWVVTPRQEQGGLLRATVRRWGSMPVVIDGLRICNLFLGAQGRLAESGDLSLSEVVSRLQRRIEQLEPAMFYLRADGEEHLIAVPGLGLASSGLRLLICCTLGWRLLACMPGASPMAHF